MAATNPATQPGAEPMDGDNLTAPQAQLILAAMTSDPDVFIDAAGDVYEAAGYPDAESMVDELVTFLSSAAGEPDEDDDEDTDEEEGANPDKMEAQ